MQQKAHRCGASGTLRAPPSELSASTEKIENADPKSVDDAQKLHQSFVAEIRIESEKIRESRRGSGELPSRRIIQLDPLAPPATPRAGVRG
jgi:hypothetical protein